MNEVLDVVFSTLPVLIGYLIRLACNFFFQWSCYSLDVFKISARCCGKDLNATPSSTRVWEVRGIFQSCAIYIIL